MLTDPSIEKLKEKSASPYDLTVLVSKRARELTDGAQPMIDGEGAANVVSLACREVAADKVVAVKGDVEDEAQSSRSQEKRRSEEEKKLRTEERCSRKKEQRECLLPAVLTPRVLMTLSMLWQAALPKKRKSFTKAKALTIQQKTKNNLKGEFDLVWQ